MDIVITDWALQSYLDLLNDFTEAEYREVLRPDAELLKDYPSHPKFDNSKFWGPCKGRNRDIIRNGYKMKWHNIGPGRVQLRLLVAIVDETAFLCNAYAKSNEKKDFREMAKMKIKIQLIKEERYVFRGRLQ